MKFHFISSTSKAFLIAITTLLATTVLAAGSAEDGGMTSSGGDQKTFSWETAWFLGDDVITYCFEISPQEGLSEAKAKADFESVIRTWKAYVAERYGLNRPEFKLNFNYAHESCNPSTRLKIYVGVENEDVARGRKLYQRPYAFSYRQEYNTETGMGRGLLWFAPTKGTNIPSWSAPYTFHGMLLHEMGHVYGCGHVKNTIMDENMVGNLQDAASSNPRWAAGGKMYMTQIDHHRYLLLKTDSNLSMKGTLHPEITGKRSAEIFEKLAGRKSRGPIKALFRKTAGQAVLEYSDDIGTEKFEMPLLLENVSSFSISEAGLFRAHRGSTILSTGSSGHLYSSWLTARDQKKYFVAISVNGNETGWPITVKWMDSNGRMDTIFQSDLWMNAGID